MRRRLNDVVISVLALSVLLLMLVSVDPRVRDQVQTTLDTPPATMIQSASNDVRDGWKVVVRAAEDHSLANAPMVIFGIASVVLVAFMLRT